MIVNTVRNNMGVKEFNIRVYGIVINDKKEVLLTDEIRFGIRMTKFPGGGLDFGEGTIDCLHREFMEEMNTEIESIQHYYTTDYFQPTLLITDQRQLISIYYLVKLKEPFNFKTKEIPFDFDEDIEGSQIFRWVNINNINEEMITFPIDRKVITMLKNNIN